MSSILAQDIQWTVKLHYGQDFEDPENKIPVLIMESTFKNISASRSHRLSFWNQWSRLSSIEPKSALESQTSNYQAMGMPAPPQSDSAIELKAGESFTSKKWYWADEILPWTSANRKLIYKLKSHPKKLQLKFIQDFNDDSLAFVNISKTQSAPYSVGTIISNELDFNFQVYSQEQMLAAAASSPNGPAKKPGALLANRDAFSAFYKALQGLDEAANPRLGRLKKRATEAQQWLEKQEFKASLNNVDPQNVSVPFSLKLSGHNAAEVRQILERRKSSPKDVFIDTEPKPLQRFWILEFINHLSGGFSVLIDAQNGSIAFLVESVEG